MHISPRTAVMMDEGMLSLRMSNLLLMKLLPEVLDTWADPVNIEVFISYIQTNIFVSSPCRNILATGQLTHLKIIMFSLKALHQFNSSPLNVLVCLFFQVLDYSHSSHTYRDRLHIYQFSKELFQMKTLSS